MVRHASWFILSNWWYSEIKIRTESGSRQDKHWDIRRNKRRKARTYPIFWTQLKLPSYILLSTLNFTYSGKFKALPLICVKDEDLCVYHVICLYIIWEFSLSYVHVSHIGVFNDHCSLKRGAVIYMVFIDDTSATIVVRF